MAQEEPVYFGPFLREVVDARANDIVVIVLAGNRGAGGHPKGLLKKVRHLYLLWLLLEAKGFLRNGFVTFWQAAIRGLGLIGTRFDKCSLEGIAQERRIPLIRTCDINSPELIHTLRRFSPDVIINQTELILKEEILKVPRIGTINRHASLLPEYRGRLASFWAHAQEIPKYGITIHFVDTYLDSGPIIVQEKLDLDPRLSYSGILDKLFKESPRLMGTALNKLEDPFFAPQPNNYQGTPIYLFPTLKQVKIYRGILKRRRRSVPPGTIGSGL